MRVLLVNPARRWKGLVGSRSVFPTVLPNSLLFIASVLEQDPERARQLFASWLEDRGAE